MLKFFSYYIFTAASLLMILSNNSYTDGINYNDTDTLSTGIDSLNRIELLKSGKKLYSEKCSKCHTLYKPKDFSIKVWKENLDEMKEKANLSDSDYHYIYEYLSENAKKKK